MEEEEQIQELFRLAKEARKNSYAPYSGFHVGACLQAGTGEFYTGCNIENAGYTATNCAERTAFFKAVSEGKKQFLRIAVVGGPGEEIVDFCPPCGVCLQVMMEFCDPDRFDILLENSKGVRKKFLLRDLLPMGFGPDQLS